MKELLEQFANKKPEIVFEWQDPQTDAEGWVVINSLRGGAAGGGTRMRKGLDRHEVESLAKTMEIKFSHCGPPIGGAKSGINFDPDDPRKEDVLERWYHAVRPLLKTYYGTGGDMNVDEVKDVIPITESLGIEHPQEGVLMGHFSPNKESKKQKIHQLQKGVSLEVTDPKYTPDSSGKYLIADLITGYGVAEGVRHFYDLYSGELNGKKAIIQGWGNVSSAAAWYLAKEGVKIVGIIDRDGGIINENGLSYEDVTHLFETKKGNKLASEELLSFEEVNSKIWDIEAQVLIPGAASRLLKKEQLEGSIANDLEVISCGANVPFADQEIFYGSIAEYADENLAIIPDFIANSGMARTFAYLMHSNIELSDTAIFEDVSAIIKSGIEDIRRINNEKKLMLAKGLEVALKKIM